jgi:hypothetical protein
MVETMVDLKADKSADKTVVQRVEMMEYLTAEMMVVELV